MTRKVVLAANTAWYIFNFRSGTIRALKEASFDVVIVAPYNEIYAEKLERMGCVFKNVKLSRSGRNPLADAVSFLHYLFLYLRLRPDAILNFTPKVNIYSTWAGKVAGAKVINNIAGLGSLFVNKSLASRLVLQLYKFSQPLADFVFFQNEDDIALFKENGINLMPNRYRRIPGSGVDLKRFPYTPAPQDGKIRFVLIARMLREKGVELLAQAARQLVPKYQHVEFYLLGPIDSDNPSAVTSAEIRAWEAEGIIKYLGVTDDVSEVLAGMDAVVLPSYYREGVPKSLLEAAAMGKPVITTDSVGCRDAVVHGVTGFLCNPRDLSSLISAIAKFMDLGLAERMVMSSKSRELMEARFSEKIVIEEYTYALGLKCSKMRP